MRAGRLLLRLSRKVSYGVVRVIAACGKSPDEEFGQDLLYLLLPGRRADRESRPSFGVGGEPKVPAYSRLQGPRP
jgi:hypothetical protein